MATAPDPITSPPDVPGQPYDATAEGPISGWADLANSGPANALGMATGSDFEDGPGPWRQT